MYRESRAKRQLNKNVFTKHIASFSCDCFICHDCCMFNQHCVISHFDWGLQAVIDTWRYVRVSLIGCFPSGQRTPNSKFCEAEEHDIL